MNARNSKRIRLKAKELLIEWLQQHVPEEEFKKSNITTKNILKFIPPDTHVYANNKFLLSVWSFKWIIKRLKKQNINNLNNVTLQDIQ